MGSKQKQPGSKGSKALERSHGTRPTARSILVVCEGKTEYELIDGLRREWRIATARVKLVDQAGVPKTVVETAARAETSALRASDIWVVFDRDEHPSWKAALDRARTRGFSLGTSNPCCEQRALLLHEDGASALHRHALQKRLSNFHRGYHHEKHPYFDLETVLAGYLVAYDRAESLLRRSAIAGDEDGAPSTRLHRLIAKLEEMK